MALGAGRRALVIIHTLPRARVGSPAALSSCARAPRGLAGPSRLSRCRIPDACASLHFPALHHQQGPNVLSDMARTHAVTHRDARKGSARVDDDLDITVLEGCFLLHLVLGAC